MNQVFGQRFIIFEKLSVRDQLFLKYGPLKLLRHFIEYRLDQLNSNHTKVAVNSAIQYFEGCSQKKCLLKVWSFLVHPPQNGNWNRTERNWMETNNLLMANIFKLQEYPTFGSTKMHNMCKIWFANNLLSLWKSLVYN